MNTIQLALLDLDNAFTKSSAKRFEDLLINNKATYTKRIDGDVIHYDIECNLQLSFVIIELLAYQSMSTYKPQI